MTLFLTGLDHHNKMTDFPVSTAKRVGFVRLSGNEVPIVELLNAMSKVCNSDDAKAVESHLNASLATP